MIIFQTCGDFKVVRYSAAMAMLYYADKQMMAQQCHGSVFPLGALIL